MYKKLLSETVIYGIGAVLPRLINFALMPLYTSKIASDEFAKFAQLYSLVAFVNIVLTFGFETAYFRFSADKSLSAKVFHTSFWFVFINAFAFLIGMYTFNFPLAELFNYTDYPEYLMFFAWIAFFDAICMVPFAFLRFTNKPIKYSAIKVFQGVFQTLLILAFFYLFSEEFLSRIGMDEKVSYPFVANVIASFSGLFLLFPIVRQVRFYFNWNLFKKMFHYAYPVMLAGLAFVINENLDKLLLRNMVEESDAGAFAACYKLASLMILIVTAYRLGVEPFFFKKAKEKDAKQTYAAIMLYFVIICGLALILLLGNIAWVKKLIIRDESYWVALPIVPIIVIANYFFGVYYNLSTWYKVTDRTYVGTIVSWVGAGLTILVNLLFIPIIGFMASAWATLVAYVSMMVISYFWGQKYYRIPYKHRKILFYMLMSSGFGIIAYFFSEQSIILGNVFVILYMLIVLFIEKKSLQLEK